jgi:hypothetical protein
MTELPDWLGLEVLDAGLQMTSHGIKSTQEPEPEGQASPREEPKDE